MWIGWIWADGRWVLQPSTRSRDLGTCSRRLGVLAQARDLPCIHQMMTGGAPPIGIVPPELRTLAEEAAPDLEGDDP